MVIDQVVRHKRNVWNVLTLLISGALLLLGCAPTSPGAAPGTSAATTGNQSTPAAPKVLRIGLQADREPPSPALFGSSGSGSSSLEYFFTFHGSLTVYDPSG